MSIPHTPAEMYPLSHPQFHRMLGYPRYDYTKYPVEANRAGLAKVLNYPRPDTEVYASKDYFIKGGRGQEMRVLAVRPAGHPLVGNGSDKIPVILALHGGGGVMGMPEMEFPSYTHFASKGYIVFSPAYSLSPEYPYPASFDDAEATWNWFHEEEVAKALGVDLNKVALFGTSSGSGLATGLAIRLKDRDVVQPKIVICDSCVVDDRVIYSAQAENHPHSPYFIWTAENARYVQTVVFGGDHDDLPIEAAPLRSKSPSDFKGLCPHYITSMELDTVVEHGLLYTQKLIEAGVSVEFHLFRAAPHGFIFSKTLLTDWAREEYARVLEGAMI